MHGEKTNQMRVNLLMFDLITIENTDSTIRALLRRLLARVHRPLMGGEGTIRQELRRALQATVLSIESQRAIVDEHQIVFDFDGKEKIWRRTWSIADRANFREHELVGLRWRTSFRIVIFGLLSRAHCLNERKQLFVCPVL